MNNNEVRTGDTDDHDEKQMANEEVSSGEETSGILESVWQRQTGDCDNHWV